MRRGGDPAANLFCPQIKPLFIAPSQAFAVFGARKISQKESCFRATAAWPKGCYRNPIESQGNNATMMRATNSAPRYGHTRPIAWSGDTRPIAQAA